MNAREFFNMVVKMRKAQRDYNKLASTRNASFKSYYEEIVDTEIERVEKMRKEQYEQQQTKML